jgi:hypothetical protein
MAAIMTPEHPSQGCSAACFVHEGRRHRCSQQEEQLPALEQLLALGYSVRRMTWKPNGDSTTFEISPTLSRKAASANGLTMA